MARQQINKAWTVHYDPDTRYKDFTAVEHHSQLGEARFTIGRPGTLQNPLLSSRETQVLTLGSLGLTTHQVGTNLRFSEYTIKTHRRRAFQALGLSSDEASRQPNVGYLASTACFGKLTTPPIFQITQGLAEVPEVFTNHDFLRITELMANGESAVTIGNMGELTLDQVKTRARYAFRSAGDILPNMNAAVTIYHLAETALANMIEPPAEEELE